MVHIIMEFGLIIKDMVKVLSIGLMGKNMLENGLRILCVDRDNYNLLEDVYIKVNLIRISLMDMVFINGQVLIYVNIVDKKIYEGNFR